MTETQFENSSVKKRTPPTVELTHKKRLKIAGSAWQTTGGHQNKQPPIIAKKMYALANATGDAGMYGFIEAHFNENEDTPFKVIYVCKNEFDTDPKQLNTLQFLVNNYNNSDKVQLITSQCLADNRSETQNLNVESRKAVSPSPTGTTRSHRIILDDEDDE